MTARPERRALLLSVVAAVVASVTVPPLAAQTDTAVRRTAETVTATALARYARPLAADSLRDRDTPSPALEWAARYVVTQFQRLGLQAGARADGNSENEWIQHYSIPGQRRLDYARSRVVLVTILARGKKRLVKEDGSGIGYQIAIDFTTDARFAPEFGPPSLPYRGESTTLGSYQTQSTMMLVTGRHTAASLRQLDLRDRVVLYVPPVGIDSAGRGRVLVQLAAASRGVAVVSDEDSAHFAAAVHTALQSPVPMIDDYVLAVSDARPWPWATYVRPEVLQGFFAAIGTDLAQLRSDTAPKVRALPSTWLGIEVRPDTVTKNRVTAPSVVGVLQGADPSLQQQAVVISARLDTDNHGPRSADGRRDAPDDGAVDVAGLLTLAEAFSQPGARPRRSLIFLAASGGTDDSWGTSAFAMSGSPGLQQVAAVSIDRIGRRAGDSVVIDGGSDLELTRPPSWIAATHAEPGLAVTDGGTAFRSGTAPFGLVRNGVPTLSFHPPSTDDADASAVPVAAAMAPDLDHAARVLRLAFYTAQELANTEPQPRWSAEGRRRRYANGLEP